ncbi:lactonase family protein [Solirubrobacter ginsenosidimutans]|uniref:Lactonase family protein n=1 Tax=Solirubrobacter ginsenosidimutans TaxID=490573 RepID=A0A9X3MMZ7_9ACTN|nr:beta-propeller fold lactonase family protein [Solirubrobacter ginsenosidimutans]MDA0159100.1 lactonase family protein [Solirubrobacter ginsenosidimutans]
MKIVALAGLALTLLLPSAASAQPGALTQAGCVSESSSGGTCADGYGIEGATAIAISPDGRNVYVAAPATQSLAVFARDAATGALTELGCFTLLAAGDPHCVRVPRGLSNPVAITVSSDGRSVYVANLADEVTVFARDPNSGALSQPPTQPCIGSWMLPGCPGSGTALGAAEDVITVGSDVYVAAGGDAAIAELRRDPATSILSQPPGRPACISRDGMASSTTGKEADCTHAGLAVKQPTALALTPAANHLFAVDRGGRALWTFPRNPAGVLAMPSCVSPVDGACGIPAVHGMQAPFDVAVAADDVYVTSTVPGGVAALRSAPSGALSQAASGARHGCVTNDGSDGCVQGRALAGAEAVVVAPDGRNVYVAAVLAGAIDTFERDPPTGGLHQLDGTGGCLSYDGAGGICAQGRLLEGVHQLVVSPDGRNLYAASYNRSAVLAFAREQPPVVSPVATPDVPAPVGDPEPAPAAAAAVVAPAARPAITAFTASRKRFRASASTRLRVTLTAPATVKITVTRRGHRKALRTRTLRPGTRSLRLASLKPGRYTARATIAGGAARTLSLTVRRG